MKEPTSYTSTTADWPNFWMALFGMLIAGGMASGAGWSASDTGGGVGIALAVVAAVAFVCWIVFGVLAVAEALHIWEGRKWR